MWFHTSEATDPVVRPQLEISWEPRLGLQRQYTYDTQQLSDRMKADVNVANGNLVLSNSDLQIAGTGVDLELGRFYNSKSARTGNLGYGWSLGTGRDVFLSHAAEGSAILYGPSAAGSRSRSRHRARRSARRRVSTRHSAATPTARSR